ncbi:MAG: SpoIIE family protein phosphatase [Planctomycetota bacterium]|nr:SpoIIE family protein phosphatase [Planctomycetota bacterium]MDA1211891.1 SpoIIE family protein phosphatase [Planctomycetota bacterium]
MATLTLLQGGESTPFDLNKSPMVIGRHPDCEVRLDSNMISRRHAQIVTNNGKHLIEDLGSGNGTFVNGQQITAPTELKHDDRIKVGPMLFHYTASAPTPAPSASSPKTASPPNEFGIDFGGDEAQEGTVMGTVRPAGGFGLLEVQPEAKLKAVLEITRNLAGTVSPEALLPKILETLFNVFPHADRGCILFKDTASGKLIPKAVKHRKSSDDDSVKLSRTIVNKVLSEKSAILSADAANDARFEASESISNLTIRSMMCAPLLDLNGEPIGIINIDTQNAFKQFRDDDLELLVAIAGQAALSYENARLLVSHMEKMKQDGEMQIAQAVQRALLPEELPQADGYQFFASYDAAQAVGGDYYSSIQLDDGRICLAFGDVAGKGVPGALIMSRISSCVQNVMQYVSDVGEAATAINNHMCVNMVEGRFVTFLLIILDPKSNEMTMVNAGHMSPMIRRPDGSIDEFPDDAVGMPIGVMEDYPYEVVSRTISAGETIVLFTDGVDEAMNPAGDLYTLERMREFIKNSKPDAEELGRALLSDVRRHAAGRPQNDDITIMTLGRNAV